MALGPNKENRKKLADRAEKQIDDIIRKSAGESRVPIATSLISGLDQEVWNILAPKYRAAGWRVAKWQSDQRDGDYLDFQE